MENGAQLASSADHDLVPIAGLVVAGRAGALPQRSAVPTRRLQKAIRGSSGSCFICHMF